MTDINPTTFGWELTPEGVGIVTIQHPGKNPLTFASYAELRNLFIGLKQRSDIKVIVMTGADGNFCSGGSVHEIIGPLLAMEQKDLLDFTEMTGDLVLAMLHCPQLIIAAIDGSCVGAGAMLALASDFRFGTARSKTAFLFVKVGLAGCDMGACLLLPRFVGQGRAAELLYTGRTMSGEEALAWGFFNRLCEPEQVLNEALALAQELTTGPTFAYRVTKGMLHDEANMGIDQAVRTEARVQAACMETGDFRRFHEAFTHPDGRRPPQFQGR